MNRGAQKFLNRIGGRVLPPQYRHVIDIEFFRTFTLRERLKLLLGWSLKTSIEIRTEHKPGKWTPVPKSVLTKEQVPEGVLQNEGGQS